MSEKVNSQKKLVLPASLSIVFLPNSLTNLLENSGLKIVIASMIEPTGIPSMQENIIIAKIFL